MDCTYAAHQVYNEGPNWDLGQKSGEDMTADKVEDKSYLGIIARNGGESGLFAEWKTSALKAAELSLDVREKQNEKRPRGTVSISQFARKAPMNSK